MTPEDVLREALAYWKEDCECEPGAVCRWHSAAIALQQMEDARREYQRQVLELTRKTYRLLDLLKHAALSGHGFKPRSCAGCLTVDEALNG